jgi:hypothetical protein
MSLESKTQIAHNGQECNELLACQYNKQRDILINYAKELIRFEMKSLYKMIKTCRYRIIAFPEFETDIFPLQKDERDKTEAIQKIVSRKQIPKSDRIPKKAIKPFYIPLIMKLYPSYEGKEQEVKRELIKAQDELDVLQETEKILTDKYHDIYNQGITLKNEQDTMGMKELMKFTRNLEQKHKNTFFYRSCTRFSCVSNSNNA